MFITIQGQSPDPAINEWIEALEKDPTKVDWTELTNDFKSRQLASEVIFLIQSHSSSTHLKWVNGLWYGSIPSDPNQQNILLDPESIPAFIGIESQTSPRLEADEEKLSINRKRDKKGLIALIIGALIISAIFQFAYNSLETSDRREIPAFTPVSDPQEIISSIEGVYFGDYDVGNYLFEIEADGKVSSKVITSTAPELNAYVDESWKITEIGSSGQNYILVLNETEALIVDPVALKIDYYGDQFIKSEPK